LIYDVGVESQEREPYVDDIDDCGKEDLQCVAEYGDIYRHEKKRKMIRIGFSVYALMSTQF